jgi:hypothetical protein
LARTVTPALLAVLVLAGCGGSRASDAKRIRSVLEEVDRDPAALCSRYATTALLTALGGVGKCEALARRPGAKDPSARIGAIVVAGDEAQASVSGVHGKRTVRLQKRGGSWRVADVK